MQPQCEAKILGFKVMKYTSDLLGDDRLATSQEIARSRACLVSLSARLHPPTPTEVRGVADGVKVFRV